MDRPATHRIRKQDRQIQAAQRQIEADKRTPIQQLAVLDSNLGVGQGAAKERAKLAALIAK